MKLYQVTTEGGGIVFVQAERPVYDRGSLIFRVRNRNVGRFPAATTKFRQIKITDRGDTPPLPQDAFSQGG